MKIGDRRARVQPMHAEYLELGRALLHWSRGRPTEIALKAELLALGLELLVDQPDCFPLRQLIKMNAADLVTFERRALAASSRMTASAAGLGSGV
jgi:hypothetical protein